MLGRLVTLLAAAAAAWPAAAAVPENGGPYNASFLAGGVGVDRPLAGGPTGAGMSYTFSAWVRTDAVQPGEVTLIALGTPGAACRCLALRDGIPLLRDGDHVIAGHAALVPGRWTHLAVLGGRGVFLFVDGKNVAHGEGALADVAPRIAIAPAVPGRPHFGGTLVEAGLRDDVHDAAAVLALAHAPPNFDLVQLWRVGVGWEWQHQANTGLWRQQDPWTLPHGKGGFAAPAARPVPREPALTPEGDLRWRINGWRLAAAPDVAADGAALSRPGFDAGKWVAATVPGTVLTTLVDRGIYPDPYYGLDNLAIPESLVRQDYWYRTAFQVPAEAAGKRTTLLFGGVNYASEVWLNGVRIGGTVGAFIRGQFDFTPIAGENVIAVRVRPPPHPGIPHEQSIAAGVGPNGGQLAIDGPTFAATEGWDWIPGIRDRDTGLWRPVELLAHGAVRILDPKIVTDLPLPRIDSADIYVDVPIDNAGEARPVTVRAAFDGVSVEKTAIAPPGRSTIRFAPAEFTQLTVHDPKLWWPNGYGEPALHMMRIEALDGGRPSDFRTVRFGIREVSYDLSLFDSAGRLRRVNVQPTDGKLKGVKLIDVTHEGIKLSPNGWAESLTPAGEHSSGVVDIAETLPEPHLAIRVNGVRIAARGGSWGMDDAMKRVGRDRLAPYFRLEREAHMNIIRNWMGNNDEDEFFDLADENGLMVLNDFWQSTQNFQVEPEDPQLFIANARDTVARYRNHPSIIVWFGRNEGVPYPILNEGLDDSIFELDGTRWYTGSSNTIDLQGSGPYNYRPPAGYYQDLATGFSVETGTPSLATAESIAATVPAADRWPLSDTLAYHDWHFSGNGDTATFMAAMTNMFGAPTDFDDFERKAQMMNFETHKAIFEGFLANLWTKNSGRLLWMTHPAWPSNAWQIYSSDYAAGAAYYGARHAAEPLHAALTLPDNVLVVINTTRKDALGYTLTEHVTGLDAFAAVEQSLSVDAPANAVTRLAAPSIVGHFDSGVALVRLRLTDASGALVSDNFYWRARDPASYRAMTGMPQVALTVTAAAPVTDGEDRRVEVTLVDPDPRTPALAARLTLVDTKGERILPAYYSDNYVSMQPDHGRPVTIQIRYPPSAGEAAAVKLDGWNVVAQTVRIGAR